METDLKRIMSLYAARGFPGCIGCIDCQHYLWEACPIG
jgi:Plant transposon protein